jgi:hypothetical protein
MPLGAIGWLAVGTVATGMYAADKANSANNKAVGAAERGAADERVLARETLDYYKSRDAASNALQAQANGIAGRVANSQIALMNQEKAIAAEYHNRSKNVFWPLEDQLVSESKTYDTPERQEAAAGNASADVGTQIDGSKRAMVRAQQRMGVNPNSGNALLLENQMGLGEASARASAANAARTNVENLGWAKRMDAASIGKGLPSAQVAAANASTNAGNAAVNASTSTLTAYNAATQTMGQGYGIALNGTSNANRLLNSVYSNQADQWSNTSNAMFGLAGSAAGSYFGSKK